MKISIIVPVLNEAETIGATLQALQAARARGHEVIIVDGGSTDATRAIAAIGTDIVIESARGRARQMNAGAAAASGELLLFLHADTRLPHNGIALIAENLSLDRDCWGRFDVRLSGDHALLRVVEALMNWRSRWTGIATGDQAIFVTRELFMRIGGYRDIPLMEDVTLSAALRRIARPRTLRARVITSSRRWERNGIIRTVFLMWRLRLAYALGADPQRLARIYDRQPA